MAGCQNSILHFFAIVTASPRTEKWELKLGTESSVTVPILYSDNAWWKSCFFNFLLHYIQGKFTETESHKLLKGQITTKSKYIFTSAKEGIFSVAFVCLCVCKTTEKVMNGFWLNLLETSGGGTRNKWLDFGDVLADTDEMRGWNRF